MIMLGTNCTTLLSDDKVIIKRFYSCHTVHRKTLVLALVYDYNLKGFLIISKYCEIRFVIIYIT